MRGGHLDLCVLGGFQVAENGDLANWSRSEDDNAPAIGGAMDLAVGARRIWVVMEHTTKCGEKRLLRRCTYPLTATACTKRVYTDLAVIDVTGKVPRHRHGAGPRFRRASGAHRRAAAPRMRQVL